MFEEKDFQGLKPGDNFDEDELPYAVNLHSGKEGESPYHWLIKNGKDHEGNEMFFRINPIKFFFCIKHENSGKIESHLWFYKGFCATTNPEYCQMIDAGTIPLKRSISNICKYMDTYPKVGGA